MRSPVLDLEIEDTLAETVKKLGGIPLHRILMKPAPGTAKARDLIAALEAPRKRICELSEGVLVEKPMGAEEGLLALSLGSYLFLFVKKHRLGFVLGADSPIRLALKLVYLPDVCFIARDRLPGGKFPKDPILQYIPNLAVEVISRGNTKGEMHRKVREYFTAGVELVWLVYPLTRTVVVHTSPEVFQTRTEKDVLDGGSVLTGFRLPLSELIELIDE